MSTTLIRLYAKDYQALPIFKIIILVSRHETSIYHLLLVARGV